MTLFRRLAGLALGLGATLWAALDKAAPAEPPDALTLVVETGPHQRTNTPVHIVLDRSLLPERWRQAAQSGPILLTLRRQDDDGTTRPVACQLDLDDNVESTQANLSWTVQGTIPPNATQRFSLDPTQSPGASVPEIPDRLELKNAGDRTIDLSAGGKPVFRYNMAPVSDPQYKNPNLVRNAYIHPVYTPSGRVVTGDFSKYHTHHRGIFLAWTHAEIGKSTADFWNIQGGKGKIVFEGIERLTSGPLVSSFIVRHRWVAGKKPVIREWWTVRAYAVGDAYRLFDITSDQQAVDQPVMLPVYYYGGMAYRGPENWVTDPIDVLTSEGLDRKRGNFTRASWCDLTGPVRGGYGGICGFDDPGNVHYPNYLRIHPTSLPFFCFALVQRQPYTIGQGELLRLRYRFMVHDGHPDPTLDDQVWSDFAAPPVVRLESGD